MHDRYIVVVVTGVLISMKENRLHKYYFTRKIELDIPNAQS